MTLGSVVCSCGHKRAAHDARTDECWADGCHCNLFGPKDPWPDRFDANDQDLPTGDVTVTSDGNHVVVELRDEAYPERGIRCRLTAQQARELSAVLALKAHLFTLQGQ